MIQYQTRCREALILGEDGSVNLDRPLEAAVLLQQALDALEPFVQKDANNYEARSMIAVGGHYLGNILRHSNPKRALEIYDHTLIRIREVPNDVDARRVEALLLASSSYAARWTRREDDARARIDAAFRLLRETKDYPAEAIMPGSEADSALNALADDYAETGHSIKAVDCYYELRRQIMASNPDPQNDLVNAARISRLDDSLAALLRRVGRTAAAAALEENRLKLWRDWGRRLPNNPFVLRQIAMRAPGSR